MTTPDDLDGVTTGTRYGLDAILIETAHATAAVSVVGGQVLSFIPTGHQHDVLWVSPVLARLPTPIRGGIPVCWPYFAREGQSDDVPSHGYARTARWSMISARRTPSGGIELHLEPDGLDYLDLQLRMTVHIGAELTQQVHTHNRSTRPAILTQALHNYFRVSDAAQVRVDGLAGRSYIDKFDDSRTHRQEQEWTLPRDVPRSDRLYPGAGGRHRLIDPGLDRSIEVTGHNAATTVIWNPGEAVAAGMADVGPHWREFLCVETANAGPDLVHVAAGSTHTMTQTVSVSRLPTAGRPI